MTPPKGPAERAAEILSDGLYRNQLQVIGVIAAEYASIEQELKAAQQRIRELEAGELRQYLKVSAENDRVERQGGVSELRQENQRLREALRDCQDFLQAIVESTNIGRITEHSILRPGEKLKTTAHKLNQKAFLALATDKRG